MATLDLANYYFQNGISRHDMQYLCTNHPFKGCRVYTVEPQGLRSASEHCYERLARVLGDLCQEGRVERQADAVFVGGNTWMELHDNLHEVLQRFRNCNLTVKPSKFIVGPKNIVLFGWEKIGDGWRPLEHTISPLTAAEPPKTVKMLRSWLGAAKQVSQCIKDYAVIFSPLEAAAGKRGSSEHVQWTPELKKQFEAAKKAVSNVETVHLPHPDDTLHCYSDYSQGNHAVGGRLEIHRKQENGTVSILHGGFFSAKITPAQARWQACEGESLGVRLVLEHFRPMLRESKNTVIAHCDNLPTCQAWQRAKQGLFSNSSRVSAFLTGISTLNVELVHKQGKLMNYSDYASRNPVTCSTPKCQICSFIDEMSFIGDNIVRHVTVSDIQSGKVKMPYVQREAWKNAQNHDKVLSQLIKLINTGQLPEKKKTCGPNTTLKLLHNLYKKGELSIDKSGLVTVRQKQSDGSLAQAIVVPTDMFPGLVNAMHLKTSHPSKLQLTKLLSRHFYCPGQTTVISEVTDNCHTCLSLKQLPSQLFPEMTTSVEGFGCNFSADVMVRLKQKILVIREKMSQFVFARLIPDETSETLSNAMIPLISDFVPESGAIIRTDNAPAFIKLNSESKLDNSVFKSSNIQLELGDTLNQNKNPVGENAIKELQKEFLRLGYSNKQLEPVTLSIAVKNINSRIRERGYSSKEMCFKRSQTTNGNIRMNDSKLIQSQENLRKSRHNDVEANDNTDNISVGDLVMLRDKLSKHEARQTFVVVKLMDVQDIPHALVQKFNDKFMSRQYRIPVAKLILMPKDVSGSRPRRKAAVDARNKIKAAVSACQVSPVKQLHSWDYDQFLRDLDEDDDVYTTVRYVDNPDDVVDSEDEFTSADDEGDHDTDSSQSMSVSGSIQSQTNPDDVIQNLAVQLQDPEVHDAISPALDEMIENMRNFNNQHPRPRPNISRSSVRQRQDLRHPPRNLMAAQNLDQALRAVHLDNPPPDAAPQVNQRPRRETREVINYNEFSKTGKKH